jgi:hypothetical protein
MWRKKLLQKEGAITQHHFGAAAKSIEAERLRQAARREAQAPTAPVPSPAVHAAAMAEAAAEVARAAAEERNASHAFAMSFSDPERENEKVQQLYRKLIDARTQAGDKAASPSLKDFEKFVRQKTKDLIEKGGHEIEYTVSVEAGRVKLKARISS